MREERKKKGSLFGGGPSVVCGISINDLNPNNSWVSQLLNSAW